jgi:hypothetical protein
MKTGALANSATLHARATPSACMIGGRETAWYFGSFFPFADEDADALLDRLAVLRVHERQPAQLARVLHHAVEPSADRS